MIRRKSETMRKSVFFLLLLVVVPSADCVQSAAERRWKPFWARFTAAVKQRNKAAVKRLMVSAESFSDGSGGVPDGDPRDGWLQMVDRKKLWGAIQVTLSKGTKPYDSGEDTPWRVTRDKSMLFVFENGTWRFFGIMRD